MKEHLEMRLLARYRAIEEVMGVLGDTDDLEKVAMIVRNMVKLADNLRNTSEDPDAPAYYGDQISTFRDILLVIAEETQQ